MRVVALPTSTSPAVDATLDLSMVTFPSTTSVVSTESAAANVMSFLAMTVASLSTVTSPAVAVTPRVSDVPTRADVTVTFAPESIIACADSTLVPASLTTTSRDAVTPSVPCVPTYALSARAITPAVAESAMLPSETSCVPSPLTAIPTLSVSLLTPLAATVAVPDAPTFAALWIVTLLPAVIVRFAAPPLTAPVASSITPAFTTAPSTSMSPSLDASATPSLPETSVLSPVPFAAVASPDTYTATDFSAVTAAPFRAANEPERLPSAFSPTSTSPFAATFAASTVTAPVASMSTSPAARTFAPVCAVTDAPSRVTLASEPTFAPFCARIAPVAFAVRSSLATSWDTTSPSAASPTVRLDVPSVPVLFMPTATVELPPTNEPPLIVTAPASASTVITPLAARMEAPPTVTPSAPASTSILSAAPTRAPDSNTTALPALSVMSAVASET